MQVEQMGEEYLEDSPIRVVVADDVADVRLVMRMALEDAGGFEVVGEARDGREARDVVVAERPDVILLDLAMPQTDGLEAIEMIKRDAPGTHIVVLTNQGRSLIAEAMARGADAFLDKTDVVVDLVAVLKSICGRRRTLD